MQIHLIIFKLKEYLILIYLLVLKKIYFQKEGQYLPKFFMKNLEVKTHQIKA